MLDRRQSFGVPHQLYLLLMEGNQAFYQVKQTANFATLNVFLDVI